MRFVLILSLIGAAMLVLMLAELPLEISILRVLDRSIQDEGPSVVDEEDQQMLRRRLPRSVVRKLQDLVEKEKAACVYAGAEALILHLPGGPTLHDIREQALREMW